MNANPSLSIEHLQDLCRLVRKLVGVGRLERMLKELLEPKLTFKDVPYEPTFLGDGVTTLGGLDKLVSPNTQFRFTQVGQVIHVSGTAQVK